MSSSVSVDASTSTYDIVHTTTYAYSESVLVSQHVARLSPRPLPHQRCVEHTLHIDPEPAVRNEHLDYFGNRTTFFSIEQRHRALTVTARSRVIVAPRSVPASGPERGGEPMEGGLEMPPGGVPAWEAATDRTVLPIDALECVFDSPSIRRSQKFSEYAAPCFPAGRPLDEALAELTRQIFEDFVFEPGSTTVTTDLEDVFTRRRGVCQDFAGVQMSCLRSLGLAAQYVSGYLETIPPPGLPRRIGADASHAWVAVYCPGVGWLESDPTNNMVPSTAHLTVARGRDYGDVSPIRGVILGGGEHSLHVSVDVARVDVAPG
jgi:transglutaminase-like putative cysteine protease